jgi:hypothetical protein
VLLIAGDCPKAETENNTTDVKANTIESLKYSRCTGILNLPPKPCGKMKSALVNPSTDYTEQFCVICEWLVR